MNTNKDSSEDLFADDLLELDFSEGEESPGLETSDDEDACGFQTTEGETEREEVSKEEVRKSVRNIIFIGPMGSGKSTICGQLLHLNGSVNENEFRRCRREAIKRNRFDSYFAYIMDRDSIEREEGTTIEVGAAYLETEKYWLNIMDAPGNKLCLPSMISATSQADVVVLVLSARHDDFEKRFEEIKEQVNLAKSVGKFEFLVVINQLDTVDFPMSRHREIKERMLKCLSCPDFRSLGNLFPYVVHGDPNYESVYQFIPMALHNDGNVDKLWWWKGPTLIEAIKEVCGTPTPNLSFRMPILSTCVDRGIVVAGKVGGGLTREGDSLTIRPREVDVTVLDLYFNSVKVPLLKKQDYGAVRVSASAEDVRAGCYLSRKKKGTENLAVLDEFDADLELLLKEREIFSAGYRAVLHVGIVSEECDILQVIKDGDSTGDSVFVLRHDSPVRCKVKMANPICIDRHTGGLRRHFFSLRTGGRTIAIGTILPDDILRGEQF